MKTTMSKRVTTAILAVIIGVGSFSFLASKTEVKKAVVQNITKQDKEITLYKSPNCSCCIGYADVLKKQGFDVKIIAKDNMTTIKEKYDVPADKQSCHTIVMGKYFVEGHVPMAAIEKLLKERPAIDGIGLAGMPTGSPGMPGKKRAPFKVYQSVNGKSSEYMTI